jgi:hypothetical protein
MLGTTVLQASQMKVAMESSGRTSDVRVAVPEMESSWPIEVVRS